MPPSLEELRVKRDTILGNKRLDRQFKRNANYPTLIKKGNTKQMNASKFIVSESKFLKSDDLTARRQTFTIIEVKEVTFEARDDKAAETKLSLAFAESLKDFTLNVSNTKALIAAYGPETEDWGGKRIELMKIMVQYPAPNTPSLQVLPIEDAEVTI